MVERGADTWWLVNLQTGETVVQGKSHLHQHTTSWAPDSSRFAYLDSQQHLCIYELSTETTSCPFEDALLRNLRWSPDGTHIAALESDEVCCDGAVWLISLPDGEGEVIGQYTSAAEPPPWGNLAWTPEGSSLLIKNTGETPATWYTLASGETRSLPAPAISLSPDGDVILYDLATDSTLAVGGLEAQETWTLPHDPACGDPLELYNWAWSPEGHRLAYVTPCPDGTSTLYLVDAAREELLWSHVLPDLEAWILRWSPDGKSLLIDDDRYQPPSPIWRLSVEGDGVPEMIVERGLLVDVVPTPTPRPSPTPIAVARLCPPASSEAEWECQDLEIAIKSQFPDDMKLRRRYSITDPPIGALFIDIWLPSDADLATWLEKQNAPNLFPVQDPNGTVGGHPAIFWVKDSRHCSFNALVSDGTYIYKVYYVIICHEDGLPAVRQMLDTFRFAGEPAVSAEIPADVWQQALEVCTREASEDLDPIATETMTPVQADLLETETATYTDPVYGFSFTYPSNWQVEVRNEHFIRVKGPQELFLSIGVKRGGEEVQIQRTGVGAGEIDTRGTVDFLDTTVSRDVLVYEGKVKEVLYNYALETTAHEHVFTLSLSSAASDYESIDIPQAVQHTADDILASFSF
jgi:hypothetical protein